MSATNFSLMAVEGFGGLAFAVYSRSPYLGNGIRRSLSFVGGALYLANSQFIHTYYPDQYPRVRLSAAIGAGLVIQAVTPEGVNERIGNAVNRALAAIRNCFT